jgi:hypothetical protein
MSNPIEDSVNLESATAEELGRLLSSQADAGEQAPNLSKGSQRAKAETRELHAHSFDLPEGPRHPK